MTNTALRSALISAAAALVLAIAGCSMMNPYDDVRLPSRHEPDLQLAGFANEALASADAMRRQYYDNLRFTSYVRNGTAITASALTGWALYNALKSSGSDAEAAAGDTRRGVRLGASLGAIYGLRQLFVNPDHESIYAEGYRALTCLMLQSAPLLMTEAKPLEPEEAAAIAASAASAVRNSAGTPWDRDVRPLYTQSPSGDLDRLQSALDRLEARILEINIQVDRDESNLNAIAAGNKTVSDAQKPQRDQISEAKTALTYARNALTDGRYLVYVVKGVGRDIQARVGLIVATVNQQVQAHQNNIRDAADVLKDAHNISDGILGIAGDTAADQATVNAAAAMSSIPHPFLDGILLAGPMSAAGGMLVSDAGAAAPAAAIAVSGAASAPKRVRKTPAVAKAAPKAASSPASAASAAAPVLERATAAELTTIRDGINVVLKRIAADQDKADKVAAEAKFTKEIAAHKATIARLATSRSAAEIGVQCSRTGGGACDPSLGEQVERLYALRRPIVQDLLNFRRKVRATVETPECAELAALRVMPNDVVRAMPGDTVSYIVRQRGAGTPIAVYQGPDDAASGAQFTIEALAGTSPSIFKAKLHVGKAMPLQTVRIIISDSKGNATQTIRVVAGKKMSSEDEKSKPSTAAASAASAASGAG